MSQINNITPIPCWNYTLGELPTSFLESMTYQEQLLWLCNYFNTTVAENINLIIDGFNELNVNFSLLSDKVDSLDNRLDNGIAEIEAYVSAELPELTANVINDKIQAGDINCQLGTSYDSSDEELTFTIQVIE